MSTLLKEIAYILDNDKMTAITGLEPEKMIELLIKCNNVIYKYLNITPGLIPYAQKDNSFWYDRNLVEQFLFSYSEIYLPDKVAPLLIRDTKKQLIFMVAPDGGK